MRDNGIMHTGWGKADTHTFVFLRRLRRSTGQEACRWPRPDEDGHCRYCGWRLVSLNFATKDGPVSPHFRHVRPKLSTDDRPETHLIGSEEQRPSPLMSPLRASAVLCGHLHRCQMTKGHKSQLRHLSDRLLVPLTVADYESWKREVTP